MLKLWIFNIPKDIELKLIDISNTDIPFTNGI